jgi:hypothetical protein
LNSLSICPNAGFFCRGRRKRFSDEVTDALLEMRDLP